MKRKALSLSLNDAVALAIKPVMRKFGFAEYRLLTEWEQIVGEQFAKRTAPVRLRFDENARSKREGGTLYIHAFDSSVALECSYLEPFILERVAGYFGFQAVKRLVIVQHPREKIPTSETPDWRAPQATAAQHERVMQHVQSVSDPDIRAQLERLGEALLARKEQEIP